MVDQPQDGIDVVIEGASGDAAAIERVADAVLPILIARFNAGGLGELEVRKGDWHVRLRRPLDGVERPGAEAGRRAPRTVSGQAPTGPAPSGAHAAPLAVGPGRPGDAGASAPPRPEPVVATAISPGVGYYATREGLATGQTVRSGDVLGHVDVLGVRQEVAAPADGIVARFLAEQGEAVEYGQELVRLEPLPRPEPARQD